MTFKETKLSGCVIIEPRVFGDNRGWFSETYNQAVFEKNGLDYAFVQDNHSYSALKGTIRALHMQNEPYAQAKLVRCVRGAIFDVAVDLRKNSPTYKQWVGVELTAENHKMLMIPRGFAHGFATLCDETEVVYKVDNVYNKDSEVGLIYNDPEIGINWGVDEPVLSEKDKQAKPLKDCVIL
jgi:dTDP-4-dehydrorhamnose 3,5-epimerase